MLVAQGAKEIPLLKVQIQRVLCWIQGIPTMTETMGSYGKHGVISWGCFCFGVFFKKNPCVYIIVFIFPFLEGEDI